MAEETTLTVLFADLVGSTQLSSQFDPEDWRDIVRAYQRVSVNVLQRLGGHVAQYQGDGLLVYFGYPQAHTDDAPHAVQAGLEIVTAVAELNTQLQEEYGVALAVRVGVHTGAAVFRALGDTHHPEQIAVGETPSIAAGIQDVADPNSVVISQATAEYLSDAYPLDARGAHTLKGVATPVTVLQLRPRASTAQPLTVTDTPPTQGDDAAERRQLTVMFCQLAGADQLAAQLLPDAVLALVREYQTLSAEVIAQYDGHVTQYLDLGLMPYFGYPRAHEDDAQRAVRAGLAILEATQSLNERIAAEHQIEVGLRIGIHTGLVVAGDMGAGERIEQLAMGETPNVAARVQGVATPGTVAISPTTAQLVTGYFEWEELGTHTLKGVPEPMLLRQVVRESGARSRLDVAGHTQAMIGREAEVQLLHERWAQSQTGQGQVVFVSGEAGIGKSRLVEALCEHAERDGATLLRFRCSPYYQNSAFYPLTEFLQAWLGFAREDSSDTKLAKLIQTLEDYRFPEAETVPLFAQLLSLPHPQAYPPLVGTPQKQRQKLQAALTAWLDDEARRQATLVVWEDLHWIDPSSVEVLSLLVKQVAQTRLCLLLAARPEFAVPWETQSSLTALKLQRLGTVQIEGIVANVTGGRQLPAELMDQIVSKTDGIPLFVEELTKTIVESDVLHAVNGHYELTGPLSAVTIPVTLQDSLMARLDRLGPAKGVAQVGAVIGREFRYDLLEAARPEGEAGLAEALEQLVAAELVYQQEPPPQASYQFKHALIQDTAYESLLHRTRQRYHHRIAQVLEERFTETVEIQPELVARHYTEAKRASQAIPYWQQAGQTAAQRSANVEAIGHLNSGLELVATLPDTPERVQQEVTLQITLGPLLSATRGYFDPEVEHTYAHALELCRQAGETPQLLPVLRGLQLFYDTRGEHQKARVLAEQYLNLAQTLHDPTLLVGAHLALGQTVYWLGDFTLAASHFEQGLALYDSYQHDIQTWAGGHPGVQCLGYLAWVLWWLGYPEQALEKGQAALALAKTLSHPFSLANGFHMLAVLQHIRGDAQATRELAEANLALSTEQGFTAYVLAGTYLRGWALTEQGQWDEGMAQMSQFLTTLQAVGAKLAFPYFLAYMAEANGKVGRTTEGLSVLDEALDWVETMDERSHEAEVYRLKGVLTLQDSEQSPAARVTAAEDCFLRALAVARQQRTKLCELRSATGLARLWQQQGKQAEARDLLAPVYDWFTEGFDTADLKDAEALLDQLS